MVTLSWDLERGCGHTLMGPGERLWSHSNGTWREGVVTLSWDLERGCGHTLMGPGERVWSHSNGTWREGVSHGTSSHNSAPVFVHQAMIIAPPLPVPTPLGGIYVLSY